MTRRAMFALLVGTVPLIALTQVDAQPMTNNMMGNMSTGSNQSAPTTNDSTDATVPPGPDMAPNTTDDAPPK